MHEILSSLNDINFLDVNLTIEKNRQSIAQKIKKYLNRKYKIREFNYVEFNFSGINTKAIIQFSTFPKVWLQKYDKAGYIHDDPIVKHAQNTMIPFRWCDIVPKHSIPFRIMKEYETFGIEPRYSFSVPVHGINGETGILSITLELPPQQFIINIENIIEDFQLLTYSFYEKLNTDLSNKPIICQLTPRQIDVLKWSCAGKSCADIATILGVSFHTVKNHLNAARQALNAINTTHACVLAIKIGLLGDHIKLI